MFTFKLFTLLLIEVCLHLICEFYFQCIMYQNLEYFSLVFVCFKLAYLTFYQSARPILLHIKLHIVYLFTFNL